MRVQESWWVFDNVYDARREHPRRALRLLDATSGPALHSTQAPSRQGFFAMRISLASP